MDRLDYYEIKPEGMDRYLSCYGWHFSKSMCEWAISMMRDRNGNKVNPQSKEQLRDLFIKNGMQYPDVKGYDDVYLAAMCKADFFGSSITTDSQLCKIINDIMVDKDGYDGMVFTRWYADIMAKGIPIIWEDVI